MYVKNFSWRSYCRLGVLLTVFCYTTTAVISTTQKALQPDKNAVESTTPASVPAADDMNLNTRNVDHVLGMCPNMLHYVFENVMPRDEGKAGIFEKYSTLEDGPSAESDSLACLAACCKKARTNNTCNAVLIFKRSCYHLRCTTNEACLPKAKSGIKDRLQMMLVSPVQQGGIDENVTWLEVLKGKKASGNMPALDELNTEDANALSFWKQPHKFRYMSRNQEPSMYDDEDFPIAEKRMKQLFMSPMDESETLTPDDMAFYGANMSPENKFVTCDLELAELGSRCSPKEECVPVRPNSATGVCKCLAGYIRNQKRECVPPDIPDYPLLDDNAPPRYAVAASEVQPVVERNKEEHRVTESAEKSDTSKKLEVSVVSKEVRLPEKEVSLAAYTVPDEETAGTKYKYMWTLITQPNGPMNGTISDQSQSKVKLSNLSEGLYTFKVTVTDDNGAYGEAMANVTVLPAQRINRIPQVIIKPKEQIIRQPTTNAVLDGSTSTDDDKIIGWQWEVVQGPIGYQPKLPEVNTLQLTDLTSPGNYTFKLTVTDSDNETNSTTANITVLKGTDYPPVANAGDGVILYLPNNNVTLNGTASTDDHEIVGWEWTKDASDEAKAVDMQNTRTPYLQLSNLEEGIYTFVLKVTDGSGQFSTAKVHVFVKPPTNSPPVAAAGGNSTINLPRNWSLLNGSASLDDIRIESYQWKQISGPNTAVIANANASIANATSLTLGLYEFQLSVTDENNNTATDSAWVKVVQEKNAAPVADAGGDQSVTLPLTALYLNGSKSSDDLAVVKYIWTRDDASLAAGTVVGNSDKEPVLILSNLVSGRYVFKLTVSDEQGLTSTDSVSVIVNPDPLLMNLVQLTVPIGPSMLTQAELNSIVQKIGLLLGDLKIHLRDMKADGHRADSTMLIFYVETVGPDGQTKPVDGFTVEQLLKDKLQRDASLLGTDFSDIRTTVCQNKCSGHGVCNAVTRSCTCEAFWMPSASFYWGLDEANCDWSILYVFVGIILTFLLLSGIFWGIACTCRQSKKPRSRPKLQKYSLIGTHDEEAPQFNRATSLSDSETDSDVLFETRTKPNGILRANGASRNNKHGHSGHNNKYPTTKLSRKIKT